MGKIHLRRGDEARGLRDAGHTASEILQATAAQVRAGTSTYDVDKFAADMIREMGCQSAFLGYVVQRRKFPGNVCISLNEEVVHGIGRKDRIIQEGDIVKLDVGIIRDGWIGDNATTVVVGEIAPETEHLLKVTEEALYRGIDNARTGRNLSKICRAIEDYVLEHRYTVVREYVGHGVGRKLHEEPQVPNYWDNKTRNVRLKAGMVLAIEPMVNLGTARVKTLKDLWTVVTSDAKPSAHYEHTVLVTDGEPEILTPRPRPDWVKE